MRHEPVAGLPRSPSARWYRRACGVSRQKLTRWEGWRGCRRRPSRLSLFYDVRLSTCLRGDGPVVGSQSKAPARLTAGRREPNGAGCPGCCAHCAATSDEHRRKLSGA